MSDLPHRILQLTGTGAIGGAEQVAIELARGCDRSRYAVRIGSLGGPAQLQERCAGEGIEARHWSMGGAAPLLRFDRLIGAIAGERERGVDLLHTYGLRADLIGRLLKKRFGAAKLLCAIHSTDAWRGWAPIRLDRWTAGAVDAFVSVSEIGRRIRIERERIPAEKIVVVPNGIRTAPASQASREAIRSERGIPADAFPVILHVANLRPMKGHGETLAAAKPILKAYPKALIVLAGADAAGGEYQRRARAEGLGERVRFLGYDPNPRSLMRAADLFILPSYYEGCPISILEAMAEGLPIIASNVGGIPEQVRDGAEAVLIPPRRADLLAEAAIRLAGDAAMRTSLIAAARERVVAEFSRETMIARYEALYQAVLDGSALPDFSSNQTQTKEARP